MVSKKTNLVLWGSGQDPHDVHPPLGKGPWTDAWGQVPSWMVNEMRKELKFWIFTDVYLGFFLHVRPPKPLSWGSIGSDLPYSIVCKFLRGSRITLLQPSSGECIVGRTPNKISYTSLLLGRSQTLLFLLGVCTLPFCLLVAYHGVKIMRWDPFSLVPA